MVCIGLPMGVRRKNICLEKHIEKEMIFEADRRGMTFSGFIELCYQHYKSRNSEEDILKLLFRKRKK